LTGLEVPGSDGVPLGLQSGPDVQLPPDGLCVCVCAGETGAPPDVVLGLGGAVCVTDVVAVVVGLLFVALDVGGAAVDVDWVEDDDLLCLWVTVVDELLLDPPQAASANASTTMAAATTATRARSPEHGVRCMT
jgi:hypothetical protein